MILDKSMNWYYPTYGFEDSLDSYSEQDERIDPLSLEAKKLEKINEAKKNEIKEGKERVGEMAEMTVEELKMRIEEEEKMRNELLKKAELKKEEKEKMKKLEKQREFSTRLIQNQKRDFESRKIEIHTKREEMVKLKMKLEELQVEKKTWNLLSTDMTANLKDLLVRERETKQKMERKLREYTGGLYSRLTHLVNEFNELSQLVFCQKQIANDHDDAVRFMKKKEEYEVKKREDIERFEKLREEEGKLRRSRPNPRKNDLYYGYLAY
ncbi:hypothetical protein GCK72_000763 [Caenorhabditis remanei]|uniref:Uncharacterized protein n=1 Tax=Caenorhabditis remanei TaxID=31234 RepID=A0A6A5HL79_CAERE|nr:hypothetical protein GCK72_000763 [Caenorhabditis remanei]KAF1768950.1 hypothetical protein GCK72_000763 [Caenorhabditis remanei]